MKMKNLILAAKKMDEISHKYCCHTSCNDKRMRSVNENMDCEWYHSSWLYSRMANLNQTETCLQSYYEAFFNTNKNQEKLSILVCGLADFAIIEDLLNTIPDNYTGIINIIAIDICNSPLELCKWYFDEVVSINKARIHLNFIQADATQLPFQEDSFDLITTYSFLTRMVFEQAQKVILEWERVLKSSGHILTTMRITGMIGEPGTFVKRFSLDSVNKKIGLATYLQKQGYSEKYISYVNQKIESYCENLMSICVPNISYIESMFSVGKRKYCFSDIYGNPVTENGLIIARCE